MKLKDTSVLFDGVQAPILRACAIADDIYMRVSRHEVTVTSAKDGKHKADSLHYRGLAVDLRTRDTTPAERVLILDQLRKALPAPFEVLDEQTHIHIEFDEKG